MKHIGIIFSVVLGLLPPMTACALPPLQLYIELTPPGGVLRLPAGSYAGPAIITRPITIDGGGKATIDAEGSGTVLTINSDKVVIRGMHITNSGNSHDQVDAGILITANEVLIEDNVIDDTLFGIHLKKAFDNTVRNNRISSRMLSPSMRGEGIRMWYSSDNRIEGNTISNVRDLLITNSPDNHIIGNTIRDSRVGMEFVFSPGNVVEGNTISHNSTGIVVLYSNEMAIRNNRLEHMRSYSGSALALKESSRVVIEGNEILRCAIGVGANAPTHPENIYRLTGNRFAYNDIALYFYGEKGGHIVHRNRFEHNLVPVAVTAATTARDNDWRANYWDTYEGFDQNGDGTGDIPYVLYRYADRIWMDRPHARFFRGTLLLDLIDFIERLAPFSRPDRILTDPVPQAH